MPIREPTFAVTAPFATLNFDMGGTSEPHRIFQEYSLHGFFFNFLYFNVPHL